ncbi:MAG: LuxR C-terminal-related transcriptional regulator [Rhizobiaceae bacterium]
MGGLGNMTSGAGTSAVGRSANDLTAIVANLGNADSVDFCVGALQGCFNHFNIPDYVLLPKDTNRLPTITSQSPLSLAAGQRLEIHQQRSNQSLFGSRSVPQFPFKATELPELNSIICDEGQTAEGTAVLNLDDSYVLPVRGDVEKAYLFVFNCQEDLYDDKLLTLQAICANSIQRIEKLQPKWASSGQPDSLSGLELSLLKCMASGCKQDDIAQEYGVSPNTISVFSSQIAKKLGASSIRQALAMTGTNVSP